MSKVAIVYWSGTGNTQVMAREVEKGARAAGADVRVFNVDEFSAIQLDEYDAVGFGCPSMGTETLEESEFEPLFASCEPYLNGKKIVLFGSYGWGDGEWMRNWNERSKAAGAFLLAESLIVHEVPTPNDCKACNALGKALAG
ncbi:MAG: flavodoxin [Spirochaetaceae bacterium]|jgi:flavodoxin short chain|nr:flavodoxin [Spirochaetaceae bacterium]